MTAHWAAQYIGTPWVAGESDCWNFARRVWAEQFGVSVPEIPWDGDPRDQIAAFAGSAERALWLEVLRPREGDAVLMARGRYPCHIGIWLGTGGILHSIEAQGVIFTRRPDLTRLGYRITGYYWREMP